MKKILLVFMILACVLGVLSAETQFNKLNEKQTFYVDDIIKISCIQRYPFAYRILAILPWEKGYVLKLRREEYADSKNLVYELFITKGSVFTMKCYPAEIPQSDSEIPNYWWLNEEEKENKQKQYDPANEIVCLGKITDIQPNSFTVLFQELK